MKQSDTLQSTLTRLEKLLEEATPGDWRNSTAKGKKGHGFLAQVWDANGYSLATLDFQETAEESTANAKLIAESRNSLPLLLKVIREAVEIIPINCGCGFGYEDNDPGGENNPGKCENCEFLEKHGLQPTEEGR